MISTPSIITFVCSAFPPRTISEAAEQGGPFWVKKRPRTSSPSVRVKREHQTPLKPFGIGPRILPKPPAFLPSIPHPKTNPEITPTTRKFPQNPTLPPPEFPPTQTTFPPQNLPRNSLKPHPLRPPSTGLHPHRSPSNPQQTPAVPSDQKTNQLAISTRRPPLTNSTAQKPSPDIQQPSRRSHPAREAANTPRSPVASANPKSAKPPADLRSSRPTSREAPEGSVEAIPILANGRRRPQRPDELHRRPLKPPASGGLLRHGDR